MTLLSNSIFTAPTNSIRFIGDDITVTQGANTLAKLDLCSIKQQYKQYQKLSVQVPAGAVDYVLGFPMMGIKVTFLTIKPTLNLFSEFIEPHLRIKLLPELVSPI